MKRSRDCYVYLITDDAGHCKIGMAGDADERRRDLQTGSPRPLRIACSWCFKSRKYAAAFESEMKHACRRHQTIGEWFKARPAAIERLAWFFIFAELRQP